ncbi:MAG: PEP-CTERM sorting domain-containing protein [Planctomycetes bacterium]|nr:PEP-CTERM sorting domain-containing protein [Planctomycetota bacterium]
MPEKLFLTLLLTLPFAACSNHGRGTLVANDGPAAPINQPDTQVIEPNGGVPRGLEEEPSSGNETGSTGGSSDVSATSTAGANSSGGSGGPANGNHGQNGAGQNGGSQSGSPVPEPGTLLLFGTGLAGLAGASLRRRRRRDA